MQNLALGRPEPAPVMLPTANAATAAGALNGDELLRDNADELAINLPRLVARSAIWVNPLLFRALRTQNRHGTWLPSCRRARKGEPRRGVVDGVQFDDNTQANLAIKTAVFGSRDGCVRMHVCHVWPETCYDVRYHTALANLVLLPAALAGFSDHHAAVAACLRYRAYELFGWHPEEVAAPQPPVGYPAASEWREPLPIPASMRARFSLSTDGGQR